MSDEKPEEPVEPPVQEGAAPTGESAEAGEPSGKRKKRKRKKAEAEEVVLRPSLRPDGRERPAFLLAFPSDPELEKLIRAFELGNYALVRKGAPELAERTTDAKVRAAAEELARRIEPDPLVKVLLGLSIALLVVLTLWAYKTHGG
ncbi:MAG TPA: hypothetical protein VNN72_15295 [Polyangiaceae bacterium]|nr:hypothetical protein [Polyangiaceae bacterium]